MVIQRYLIIVEDSDKNMSKFGLRVALPGENHTCITFIMSKVVN